MTRIERIKTDNSLTEKIKLQITQINTDHFTTDFADFHRLPFDKPACRRYAHVLQQAGLE